MQARVHISAMNYSSNFSFLEYFRTSRCVRKLNHVKYCAMHESIITALYLCENLPCELLTIIACEILSIYGI